MTSSTIADVSVGELVRDNPHWARVFEKNGIDYCCSGGNLFSQACNKAGCSVEEIMRELENCGTENVTQELPESLSALADHIIERHHTYLREELPRLDGHLSRVVKVHGEEHPELSELYLVFRGLQVELAAHMMKEEQVLFPMVRQLETAQKQGFLVPEFHCGSVRNPIRMMEHEHDDAGNALRRMRQLTKGFVPPEDACNTFRVLYAGLAELEVDLHLHIHKENNILFPQAAALETSLLAEV